MAKIYDKARKTCLPAIKDVCWKWHAVILILLACLLPLSSYAGPDPHSGAFLVATKKLDGTNFQETVILLTHFSKNGATGLAINRPTKIPLSQAFPRIQQLAQTNDPLYLGGPVNTNAIFVLVRTTQPHKNMHLIIDNLYFSTGKNAFGQPLKGSARTYAGYTGWAPGQLQNEIARGDWIVVKANPAIVFEENPTGLWNRLKNRWSGNWI